MNKEKQEMIQRVIKKFMNLSEEDKAYIIGYMTAKEESMDTNKQEQKSA